MDQDGHAGPADVVLDEPHVLAAQPGREQILHGETGRAELVGCKHDADREDDISQSERDLGALHTCSRCTPLDFLCPPLVPHTVGCSHLLLLTLDLFVVFFCVFLLLANAGWYPPYWCFTATFCYGVWSAKQTIR